MPYAPVAQGRHGYVKVGSTYYPAYNWRLDAGRNLSTPMPVGSSWAANFAEGLRTSRFTASFLVGGTTGGVMGASGAITATNGLLGLALYRSDQASGFDDTSTATLEFSNGKRVFTLASAKLDSFTLSVQKGAPIGFQAVFVAPGVPSLGDRAANVYNRQIDVKAAMMFDALAAPTGFAGNLYALELTYSNNHVVNAPLDGTKFASGWDAGPMTCGASFTLASRAATSDEPFADAGSVGLAFAVLGASPPTGNFSRTMSLTSVVPANPVDAGATLGQAFQTYQCAVLGSQTVPPLVLA